ncbi:DUF188 domain-containing protein [Candidatus Woesearchaeota archaeon]|nr:DUF188 domain-containing protein [Candidatus Woesearchaeota archaeon]
MKKIIIDTNFLMLPYKLRIDIFSEFSRIRNFNYTLHIFEQSINELRNIIEKQSGIDKKSAQFALKLIKLKNINVIKSSQEDVDSLILNNLDKDTIIATQDIILKKELLKKGTPVIILRQKKYLQLVERKLYK